MAKRPAKVLFENSPIAKIMKVRSVDHLVGCLPSISRSLVLLPSTA